MNIKQRYLTKGQSGGMVSGSNLHSDIWYLYCGSNTFLARTLSGNSLDGVMFDRLSLLEPSVASKPVRHDALWEVRKYWLLLTDGNLMNGKRRRGC
jgi:hypothetical protein